MPELKLQISGIIGYPVFQALEKITFEKDGRFVAGNDSEAAGRNASALFMDELTPLVSVGCSGVPCLMQLDTGAAHSFLTFRYWTAHKNDLSTASIGTHSDGGRGISASP